MIAQSTKGTCPETGHRYQPGFLTCNDFWFGDDGYFDIKQPRNWETKGRPSSGWAKWECVCQDRSLLRARIVVPISLGCFTTKSCFHGLVQDPL